MSDKEEITVYGPCIYFVTGHGDIVLGRGDSMTMTFPKGRLKKKSHDGSPLDRRVTQRRTVVKRRGDVGRRVRDRRRT